MHGGAWVGGSRAVPPPAHGRPIGPLFALGESWGPPAAPQIYGIHRTKVSALGARERVGTPRETKPNTGTRAGSLRLANVGVTRCRRQGRTPDPQSGSTRFLSRSDGPAPEKPRWSGATGSRRESRLTRRRHQLGPTACAATECEGNAASHMAPFAEPVPDARDDNAAAASSIFLGN